MAKIKFTDISEKLNMPPTIRAKASDMLSIIINYGVKHYDNTKKMRDLLLRASNVILFHLVENDPISHDWLTADPLKNIPSIDEDTLKSTLNNLYLSDKNVEWDLEIKETVPVSVPVFTSTTTQHRGVNSSKKKSTNSVASSLAASVNTTTDSSSATKIQKSAKVVGKLTDKTDLYLQGPKIPQFDNKSVWMQGQVGFDKLVIYESLPKIPKKQSDISVTTDVTKMTDKELMRLYPNCFIRTRNEKMYEPIDGVDYDERLGLLLPVCTFTREQIRDNIIKYPHLYKLVREIDGQFVSFYSHIEIDGELVKTLDIWDSLSESKIIPKQSEFIKEYVVRRYLLERDILGVKHNYPLFGTLDPYLTLFMPSDDYIDLGYPNTHEIVIQCVKSRVSFKQSRNPVIRRLASINV